MKLTSKYRNESTSVGGWPLFRKPFTFIALSLGRPSRRHVPNEPAGGREAGPRTYGRARQRGATPCQEILQRDHEKQELDDDQNHDGHHDRIDARHLPRPLRARSAGAPHLRIRVAHSSSPFRWSSTRASGRGGGPESTFPSSALKNPWWQGHSIFPDSRR